jgi:hypothetical protein
LISEIDVPTSAATAAATDSAKPENTITKAINIEMERKKLYLLFQIIDSRLAR